MLVKDRNEIVAEIRKYSPDSTEEPLAVYLESETLQGRLIPAKRSGSDIATILARDTVARVDWKSAYTQSRNDRA